MDLDQQINKNVVTIKVKLSSYSIDPIKSMWSAARNCYYRGDFCDLEKTYIHEKAVDLLKRITKRGHLSILEQCFFQFQISGISRSCLAQFTRHRVGWTFAVQSQHYQKHDDFTYKDLEKYIDNNHKKEYYDLMEQINKFYKKSFENEIPRYIAREVLPNSTSVHLVAAANLSSLKHFWALRIAKGNTPEIRKLAFMMYNAVINKFPDISKILQTNYEV
jgi:thymidylate synthase (FAD)